jgi:hypothetical protein
VFGDHMLLELGSIITRKAAQATTFHSNPLGA